MYKDIKIDNFIREEQINTMIDNIKNFGRNNIEDIIYDYCKIEKKYHFIF